MREINTFICSKCNKQFHSYDKDLYYCASCSGSTIEIDKLPERQFKRSVESWNIFANQTNNALISRYNKLQQDKHKK